MFNYKAGIITAIFLSLAVSAVAKDKRETKGICASAKDDLKAVCAIAALKDAKKQIEDAKKTLYSQATASERSALKQVEKAQKEEHEEQERALSAFTQANVQGCEDPHSVEVIPFPWRPWKFWATGLPFMTIRVTNKNPYPIDIDSAESGLRVRNLCSYGAVSIIRPFVSGIDGDYTTMTLIARGHNGEGTLNSQQFTLSVQNFNRIQSYVWDIGRLQK